MQSKFEDHKCGECGSEDLAHFVEWYSGQIPAGIEAEIACRGCSYWEKVLTTSAVDDIFVTQHSVVLEAGRGRYDNPEERDKTTIYRNPEAMNYPRFGL